MRATRYVATLLLSACLLAGCGDDSGDETAAPRPSAGSSDTTGTTGTTTAPDPCDVLTGPEVQRVLDAPVTARSLDAAGGPTCVYEPGADAPTVKMIELEDKMFVAMVPDISEDTGKTVEKLEIPRVEYALLVSDPKEQGSVVAYADIGADVAYELQVEAGGLGDPAKIAERLLALLAA